MQIAEQILSKNKQTRNNGDTFPGKGTKFIFYP